MKKNNIESQIYLNDKSKEEQPSLEDPKQQPNNFLPSEEYKYQCSTMHSPNKNNEGSYVDDYLEKRFGKLVLNNFTTPDKPPEILVVLDLEATCDINWNRNFSPLEIIEFSSIMISAKTYEVLAHFQAFVKPIAHPMLTSFCVQLTGITQEQVDNGLTLQQTLTIYNQWLQEYITPPGASFAVVCWTDWDLKTMLHDNCKMLNISRPKYFNAWIDVRKIYREKYPFYGTLADSAKFINIEIEGREHSGICDCLTTAKIVINLMSLGITLNVTNWIPKKQLV